MTTPRKDANEHPRGGHLLAVGELYHPTRKTWPEVVEYNYRGEQHELRLFYKNLTAEEREAIRSAPARFAFAVAGDVIYFCWKFGALPWADSTYSAWLVSEEERIPPPEWTEPQARALLTVILVESTTGIVEALRACTFSPDFTKRLHKAIRAQLARPFPGDDSYMRQCKQLYASYSSSAIAEKLALAKCKGGD